MRLTIAVSEKILKQAVVHSELVKCVANSLRKNRTFDLLKSLITFLLRFLDYLLICLLQKLLRHRQSDKHRL